MLKVRIDKCSFSDGWYKNMIEEDILATNHPKQKDLYHLFGSNNLCIQKSDCTIISDDTEQEEKEFVLPEKWCVSHCKESLAWIQKNAEIGGHRISKSNWYMFPNNKKMSNSSYAFPEGYAEITQDQFFAHVWDKEFKKEKPIFGGKNGLLDHFKIDPKPIDPVLIAKAGEWVKIVDIGNGRLNDLTLNKPYEISEDYVKSGRVDFLKDDACEQNSFTAEYIKKIGMKFERCEAPVPVGQETTEDNYASSVEEEHEEKINNTEVACAIAGFNLKRKDLDMFVSMYDLVCEYGGKLDLDTITDTKFKVNSRHDSIV